MKFYNTRCSSAVQAFSTVQYSTSQDNSCNVPKYNTSAMNCTFGLFMGNSPRLANKKGNPK